MAFVIINLSVLGRTMKARNPVTYTDDEIKEHVRKMMVMESFNAITTIRGAMIIRQLMQELGKW